MKSRSMGYLVVSLVVASLSPQLMGADYSKEMRKAFEKAFKGDFKQYQFFGTPVSNFGVATMYPKPATGNTVDLTTVGLFGNPENWWVPLSLTDADRQSLLNALRPSGETGAVAFQLDTSKTFNLSAVLPGLAKLLTASGNVSWSKKVTVRNYRQSREKIRASSNGGRYMVQALSQKPFNLPQRKEALVRY